VPENPRIEELRRRVHADPASIAFAALAEEFRRVGRHEEAIDTCRTGLQRHPAYLSARVTLGRALIETNDFDGAREEFETVLRSAPENLAAIRGLETIHERLGHSSEMDPHIAEQMKTMHAESIRVPVKPPPPPPPEPVVPEPVAPEPIVLEPIFAAPGEPEPSFDPFAQFPPKPRVEEPEPEPELDLSLAPPLGGSIILDPDLALMLDSEAGPESGQEPGVAALSGPDPEVLATVARLERFLDSIQSLRA
jgi:tetratricopeptide (TPR) repeat protein